MPAPITVQGERYADLDELGDAILELRKQLENMPSDTPNHASLAAHLERLENAHIEASGGVIPPDEGVPERAGQAAPPEDDEEEEEGHVPVPDDLEDTGELTHCPACGWPLDIDIVPASHPDIETCPGCMGFGKVLTGSRVEGHTIMDCPTCKGQGWRNKQAVTERLVTATRAETPIWNGARLSDDGTRWIPAEGEAPPWQGATWDEFRGTWA